METETALKLSERTLTLGHNGASISIPLSPDSLTLKYFRHAIPTPTELEYAIQEIEDALRPAYNQITGGTLVVQSPTLYGMPTFIPFARGLPLTRETLEDGFQRLAALSEGRPATQDPLPGHPNFPAFLLILRELMHHLNFSHLQIRN